jgi:DNA-binding response OmpR family regulator
MTTILIVDDDPNILEMLELTLRREGYEVLRALGSREALHYVSVQPPDMFVIDAGMPDIDGINLCRRLREMEVTANTPILFLSGMRDTEMAVQALNSGADDYLRKPIMPRELAARVRAHIRRASQFSNPETPTIRISSLTYRVFMNDREISLTRMEFELLKYLCLTPGITHSTEDLLEHVWMYPNGVGDAALVRNHIHNLRAKIEQDPDRPTVIQSRHGRGYVVKAQVQMDEQVALH